ncbi:nucleolar preribosomal GTPase, putative [Plasmodium vinckei lentum]|uniref:Nucleolar preribosomal GTPase, putative n=1 Tax=Plasmodium vinckei lentum TaxID=138297 RepID=A0A6V7S104_PLAVN|nr:nucleolar preribosomal GTPase, putative [Plasmodium vinckei lentum]
MVKLKKISKRRTLKQKYSIEKKVAAHKKKLKKIVKKTNIHNRRTKKKALKISDCIFKESILNNIKHAALSKKKKNRHEDDLCKEINIETLDDSTINNIKYELNISQDQNDDTNSIDIQNCNYTFQEYIKLNYGIKVKLFENAKKENYSKLNEKYLYIDNLLEVIKNSDIIFYLVDIRNPLIYLDKDIIDFIKMCKKEIIIILNKCDLVDKEITKQWLLYFRNYYITIPFICDIKNNAQYLQKQNNQTKNTNPNQQNQQNNNHIGTYAENFYQNNTNYNIKQVLKNIVNSDIKITYGVVGYIYTGRRSFMKTMLNEFNFVDSNNKQIDVNVADNINIYTKCGLILKNNLEGIELIKKLHSLNNKEKLFFLSEFLLNLSGKNFINFFILLNENQIGQDYKTIFVNAMDKAQKKEIKKDIISQLLLIDIDKSLVNNNINFKNVTSIFSKIFLNKIPYYVIPKSQIMTPSNDQNNSANLILEQFPNIIQQQIYSKVDDYILSKKNKFTSFIIIKSDKFNFYI